MISKKIILIFLFLISGFFLFSQKNTLVDIAKEKYADSIIDAGKYDEGISVYNELLKKSPKNEGFLRGRAYAHLKKGDWKQAISEYKKITSLFSHCGKCMMNLSKAYYGKGDNDSALLWVNNSIKTEPDLGEPHIERARIRMRMSKRADSLAVIRDLNWGINSLPDVADFYLLRSKFYFSIGNIRETVNDLDRTITLDSNNFEANLNASVILFVIGEKVNWPILLDRCSKLKPNDPAYLVWKSAVRASAGDTLQLRAFADSVFLSAKNDVKTNFLYAYCLYKFSDAPAYCSAIETGYRKMKTAEDSMWHTIFFNKQICEPGNIRYYLIRAQHLGFDSLSCIKAINLFSDAQKDIPNNSFLGCHKTSWLVMAGRYEEGLKEINTSIQEFQKEHLESIFSLSEASEGYADTIIKHFRFWQLLLKMECFTGLTQSRKHDLTDYEKIGAICDSAWALLKFADSEDKKSKFIYVAAFIYFELKNENKITRLIGEMELGSSYNPSLYYLRAMLLFENGCPGSYEEYGPKLKDIEAHNFDLVTIKKKIKKINEYKLGRAVDDLSISISADPANAVYVYMRGMIRYEMDDHLYCEDIKAAYDMGLDKAKHLPPPHSCGY